MLRWHRTILFSQSISCCHGSFLLFLQHGTASFTFTCSWNTQVTSSNFSLWTFLWHTHADPTILSGLPLCLFLKSTVELINICASFWNPYGSSLSHAYSFSLTPQLYHFYLQLSFLPEFLLSNMMSSSSLVTVIDWVKKMTVVFLSAWWKM